MGTRSQSPPPFGHRQGFLFPLVWRILRVRCWPLAKLLPDSRLIIDIYILAWWIAEAALIVLCSVKLSWQGWGTWVAMCVLLYRLLDVMWVLTSMLLTGHWKRGGSWASLERVLFLVLCNAVEILVLFGAFYWAAGLLLPNAGATTPGLSSFFDAIHFSVVTGTTLGYGSPHPQGWLAKALSIAETWVVLLLVIVLIGYVLGARDKPTLDEDRPLGD